MERRYRAYPKVNLGLHILGKRADAYHDLETVFVKVKNNTYFDELIFESSTDQPEIIVKGWEGALTTENNLCYKAFCQIKPFLPDPNLSFQLTIDKKIPTGAGLGGGSADAGMALRAFNEFFNLNFSLEQLRQLGAKLGSDVPFFLWETDTAYAKGRGIELESYELDLSGYEIRIYPTDVHSSTQEAYAGLDLNALPERASLKELLREPISAWKDLICNDFEPSLFRKYPQIAETKQRIYDEGAVYASMTGSGSACFGIFKQEKSSVLPDLLGFLFDGVVGALAVGLDALDVN
jgi:4-diphosphocytidyl-2-C-methyl-D-erythritol kinase